LNATINVNIIDINPENHTVLANVTVILHNFPHNDTTNILVKFENDENYEVNCSRIGNPVNGLYEYKGKIDGKYWYLATNGELYPFDFNFVSFKLNPDYLFGAVNGTTYGPNLQYSLNIIGGAVNYYGFHWKDFHSMWKTFPTPSGERFMVVFQRSEQSPQYMIFIPLIWILTLITSIPLLTTNKKIKIEFYSAMLVFAPVFIFTIQGFIPPRSSFINS
jgi:hypothetical protein